MEGGRGDRGRSLSFNPAWVTQWGPVTQPYQTKNIQENPTINTPTLQIPWVCMYHILTIKIRFVCLCRCACHGIPMEARGQFCGVGFLLVPFCGVQGLNLGHQACMASVLPAEPCHQPYINTSDACCQIALPEIASHPLVPYLPLAIGYPYFLPSPIYPSTHPRIHPSTHPSIHQPLQVF